MGGWAEDGMTYYIGQSFRGVGGTLPIIDVSDPYNAKHLLTWTFLGDGRPHDLSTNTDAAVLGATRYLRRGGEQFFLRSGRAGDPGRKRH